MDWFAASMFATTMKISRSLIENWFTRRCILNCMCILFNWILHVEQFINIRWHDHQCFNSSAV